MATLTTAITTVDGNEIALDGRVATLESNFSGLGSTYYTQSEIDTQMTNKANSSALSNYLLSSTADTTYETQSDLTANYYNRTDVDSALALKQDVIVPTDSAMDLSIYINDDVHLDGTLVFTGSLHSQYARAVVKTVGKMVFADVAVYLTNVSGSDWSTNTSQNISIVGLPAPASVIATPYNGSDSWLEIGSMNGAIMSATVNNSETAGKTFIVIGEQNLTNGFRIVLRDIAYSLIVPNRINAGASNGDALDIRFKVQYISA